MACCSLLMCSTRVSAPPPARAPSRSSSERRLNVHATRSRDAAPSGSRRTTSPPRSSHDTDPSGTLCQHDTSAARRSERSGGQQKARARGAGEVSACGAPASRKARRKRPLPRVSAARDALLRRVRTPRIMPVERVAHAVGRLWPGRRSLACTRAPLACFLPSCRAALAVAVRQRGDELVPLAKVRHGTPEQRRERGGGAGAAHCARRAPSGCAAGEQQRCGRLSASRASRLQTRCSARRGASLAEWKTEGPHASTPNRAGVGLGAGAG